jgi:hypothetical protein
MVGPFYRGQIPAPRPGIDGLLLAVVVGDGKWIVPVAFEIRRPDPKGPGRPCSDKLTWLALLCDRTGDAFQNRGLDVPKPIAVADSWFGESDLMEH